MNYLTKLAKRSGVLPDGYEEELIRDYCFEFGGGRYEELDFDGLALYFPQCAWDQVAFAAVRISDGEFDQDLVTAFLSMLELPTSPNLVECDYRQELLNHQSCSRTGTAPSGLEIYSAVFNNLVCLVLVDESGRFVSAELYDLELAKKNDADNICPSPQQLMNGV